MLPARVTARMKSDLRTVQNILHWRLFSNFTIRSTTYTPPSLWAFAIWFEHALFRFRPRFWLETQGNQIIVSWLERDASDRADKASPSPSSPLCKVDHHLSLPDPLKIFHRKKYAIHENGSAGEATAVELQYCVSDLRGKAVKRWRFRNISVVALVIFTCIFWTDDRCSHVIQELYVSRKLRRVSSC